MLVPAHVWVRLTSHECIICYPSPAPLAYRLYECVVRHMLDYVCISLSRRRPRRRRRPPPPPPPHGELVLYFPILFSPPNQLQRQAMQGGWASRQVREILLGDTEGPP